MSSFFIFFFNRCRFHCQSSVTASCFAKFHPNLVIGGTYSGQIVIWDNRSSRRTAQRSKLSTAAHTVSIEGSFHLIPPHFNDVASGLLHRYCWFTKRSQPHVNI